MPDQPWGDIRGMGNRLRHAYDRINLDVIWNAVPLDVPGLAADARRALAQLRATQRRSQPVSSIVRLTVLMEQAAQKKEIKGRRPLSTRLCFAGPGSPRLPLPLAWSQLASIRKAISGRDGTVGSGKGYTMRLKPMKILLHVLTGGLLTTSIANAADPVRGVTDTEITIGTITDLSGVTAVQGVNNSDAVRMAFDEANEKGGVNGRKIKYVVEDNQYQVPRAVQAMNKLLNSDNVFMTIDDGGTPMNDANMPTQFAKNVPNMFPLTAARSMYEPYNRLKFGQFASYYDQMRAAVKYFAENKGRKAFCVTYQDSDFGKDVLAGVVAETQALGLKVVETTAHRPTDTDFNAPMTKLHDAGCDIVMMGTIVRDTNIIIQTVRKMSWNVDSRGPVRVL